MTSPQRMNQKKIILSTTEVSKLLLSQGRRKIDDSFLSHNEKKNNNIDITEIASQINIKLSKGDENLTSLGLADQSMFKGVLEKSVLFKPTKALDKSGIANNADKYPKESILSKLDKSQAGNGLAGIIEPVVIPEAKPRKKILKIDGNEIFANNGQIKLPYIINNYFPYENDNNNNIVDPENANRLKNFLVIFYFKIEKSTFVLIRKIDKKFVPIYFWNKEEDAMKFGIKYSQISTPGLYFKTFENFTNAFKEKIDNRLETIELRKNLNAFKEKCSLYEQTIENMKKEHEKNIEENINENNNLKSKIIEMESIVQLKDAKIKTLSKNIDELNEEIKNLKNSKTLLTDNINELKILNDKLKKENKELQKNIIQINERIKTNNNNIKNRKSLLNNNNNNNNSESDNEEEEEISEQNKNKIDYNMRNPKKSKTKNFNDFNTGKKMNFNNFDILREKNNYQRNDNPINSLENEQFDFTSDENSMPKLSDYNIENDEDDKINEVRNIDEIQTFLTGKNKNKNRSKKSLKKEDSYSNNNSYNNNNNNVIVYISDNSNNKKNRNRSKSRSRSRSRSKSKSKNNSKDKDFNKNNLNKINEEQIDSKDQEILILKNKIENLNLEIQNKSHIIEELKYLIDSKSNNNSSNIEGIKMESSFINKNDISSNN